MTIHFPTVCVMYIFKIGDLGPRRTQEIKDILYDKNNSSPNKIVL